MKLAMAMTVGLLVLLASCPAWPVLVLHVVCGSALLLTVDHIRHHLRSST